MPSSSQKRKFARKQKTAKLEVEEAELQGLALFEIQAKKSLLAARNARDSLLPSEDDVNM